MELTEKALVCSVLFLFLLLTGHVEEDDPLQHLLVGGREEPGGVEDAAVPVDGDGRGDAPVGGGHEGVVPCL